MVGSSASQIPPLRGGSIPRPLAARRLAYKEGALMGRLGALCMPNLNVLCRTFISKGGTLYPDRAICDKLFTIGAVAVGPQLSLCNTVIVIYQKDFSTLSHILFL